MFDDTDRAIIAMLGRDGRRTFTSMAAELEVSEATVRGRVAKLQELQALRIVALCNPITLGHQSLRLMIEVRDHTPRSVAVALTSMPPINHVALCTGSRDVYAEGTCRDISQVRVLLDDVRRIPGVATIDLYLLTELFKDYSWVGLRGGVGQGSTASPPG
ncbi:Lrp/AsnC family transcriptional regulator [Mycolicibacterium komossense]|uniref:Lrp/AsnC family transcriptional regulator n=1 Tax=Mycolicibacterium komossense TaxID=1779 RepID=A0ABT3CCV6_9MYCO|nr:Lrp/AsnC family transcriptional regulator [Mycolicibacterium komossense]MCV7227324.1 Lrp/AsnC family transcriptional regulator [Mycolicibacterium komossense]